MHGGDLWNWRMDVPAVTACLAGHGFDSRTLAAGPPLLSFLRELDRIGVPAINLRDEQIEAEIRAARELAG